MRRKKKEIKVKEEKRPEQEEVEEEEMRWRLWTRIGKICLTIKDVKYTILKYFLVLLKNKQRHFKQRDVWIYLSKQIKKKIATSKTK